MLIVDDEPKVREGLKAIIPWEECGFTVAGTATNGFEAIEQYEKIKPELVVADIRMPGMDGLQLIQSLRERDDRLHILILSGYADFDYAKKAISHRADGYLLKPVDEEEMISYLEKIREDHKQAQENKQWNDVSEKWTRDIFIQSLLTRTGEDEENGMEARAESLGLIWKEYQVMLLHFHQRPGSAGYLGRHEDAEQRLNDYFEASGRGLAFSVHFQTGILLKSAVLGEQMRRQLYNEIMAVLEGTGVQATVALGPFVRTVYEICHSYEAARELLKHEFFIDADGVLTMDDLETRQRGEKEISKPEDLEGKLYYAMDIGNRTALEPLIRSAGEWLKTSGATEADIKRYFAELLSSLLARLSASHTILGSCLKDYTDRIALIYQQRSLRELYRHIGELLNLVMEPLGSRSQGQDIKALLDFIQRNFGDNLKLETLAGVFNYNTAYLGKMFKNATGEYFNTYLDKVRIEHAKQYLQQGMKVYQVAEKVGYTNVDYFHSKFRKYVGMSPSSYRKNAGQPNEGVQTGGADGAGETESADA
ncbi:response regulator transcription factor [Paenibacillus yonginensis]|uniref:response regulator transcription factor n=1 Tax=Paenibacillus yonginensis TaxID=1462996 RepID=UPI001F433B66|nr:response regulator transcription factor [Paenibacillus yonginensis]